MLGSGQFGTVYKGVLGSGEGGGEVEVAVKTLKEGSGEEDRVKFLQEAAIMGQFKHHNVVTMYGVVTEGEPVSVYAIQCIEELRLLSLSPEISIIHNTYLDLIMPCSYHHGNNILSETI